MSEISTTAEAQEASALPRAHAVHSDPAAHCAEGDALPPALARQPVAEKSPAQWAYERMCLYIRSFEEQLDATQEVAMGFAGSAAGVLRIEGLGYFAPDMLTFYGRDGSGARAQLVQHVAQLNVLLQAVPKVSADPPRRIGFRLVAELEREAGEIAADPARDP